MINTDAMIDLETLGTRPGSVVTQIGLCAFNPSKGILGVAMHLYVKPQSQIDRGFHVDWDTVAWWMQQNDAARSAMVQHQEHAHEIEHALALVAQWFATNFKDPPKVWGHGATFDVTQLEIAYTRFSMILPWEFRNVRDTRTLVDQLPGVIRPAPFVEHNALDDACAQAQWVLNMFTALRLRAVPTPEPKLQP